MRILLLVNNLAVGGAETQTVRLARALVSRGHQVHIGYFSAANAFSATLDERGIGHNRIRPRPSSYRPWTFHTAANGVMALCGEFAPDVVHSQLELADVVGQMVAMKFHLPHVITFHNTHWWAVRNVASHWRIAYRKYWLRRGRPSFVAVSRAAACAAANALGIDDKNITVVHNGIDLSQFLPCRWLKDGAPPARTWQLLCVGRLEHVKGQDVLIRALASDELQQQSMHLLLVGDGTARPDLQCLVDELGLSHKVSFLGIRQDIPGLLAASDIYIQPSRSEGLSNALIEALAAGLPVVVTEVPGMLEVLTANGAAGLGSVVPCNDPVSLAAAISPYLHDPLECRRQARLAKECASQFSIETIAQRMENIYVTTMSRSSFQS